MSNRAPRAARAAVLLALITLVSGAAAQNAANPNPAAPPPPPADGGWPRVVANGADSFTVYQPQIDAWDGNTLSARFAISALPANASDAIFGVAFFTARSDVDKVNRIVYLEDMKFTNVKFPTAPKLEAQYRAALQAQVPSRSKALALDRILAELAINGATVSASALALANAPPHIILSDVPAVLIAIDGVPVWRAVKGTVLQRIINTSPVVVRTSKKGKPGTIYLHLFDGWMQADSLSGAWAVTTKAPVEIINDLNLVLRTLVDSGEADPLVGAPADPFTKVPTPSLLTKPVPKVIIATSSSELIVTEGAPAWTPVDGVPLHYVKNTSGRILQHDTDKKVYLLLAGRWFRADSLSSEATWEHVPGKSLPKTFAEIPDSSAIENVKAAIPGTTQAAEAMIENTIPQTQTLSKKGTKFDPFEIDGPLQMQPIEGTKLQYVANASRPVIQVASDLWFACESGIWFVAASVDGPWSVATSVSPEIYGIPASSPLHYVTYVKVYGGNTDSVFVGYTPGYTGTVVSDEGTVVYGTGYNYVPWVGTDWYGAPYTYGYGANIGWTPWYGWRYGAGYGYAYGWGGYGLGSSRGVGRWGVGDWGAMTGNVYDRWGPRTGVTNGSVGANPYTGNMWADRSSISFNSRTGWAAAGQRGAYGNVYTGNYGGYARGTAYNYRTGDAVSYGAVRGENGGAVRVGNNVYASRDGTVFRYNGDNGVGGGWGRYDNRGQWNNVDAGRANQLNRDASARNMGNQRYNNFNSTGGARVRAGGGYRGGGGRRR